MIKENIKALISMIVTIIGGLGVGINILLSEILYADIDYFSDCPLWYQIFMYVSLVVALAGIILSAFTKNKSNTSYKELYIEMGFIVIGFIGMMFALIENEKYLYDVIICIGGAFFFCWIVFFYCDNYWIM